MKRVRELIIDQQSNIVTILAILGLIDTIYLTNLHYSDGVCIGESSRIGNLLVDCGAIASSDYSEVLGVPIAIIGFVYYLTIFVLTNYSVIETEILAPLGLTALLSLQIIISAGTLISFYLFYLQIFVLELICSYCMASILTTLLLFSLITLVFFESKNKNTGTN